MKRAISLLLTLSLVLGLLCACDTGRTLDTPGNPSISSDGVISWDAVDGADSYVVTVGDNTYTVTKASYTVTKLDVDFNFSVVARGAGYRDSAPSETKTYTAERKPPVPKNDIAIAILGGTELRPGNSMTLTALVTGTDNSDVIWEITDGEENAEIDPVSGVVTASKTVTGSGIVTVRATSLEDK